MRYLLRVLVVLVVGILGAVACVFAAAACLIMAAGSPVVALFKGVVKFNGRDI